MLEFNKVKKSLTLYEYSKPPQSAPPESADPASLRLALCYTLFGPIYYIQ